MNLEVDHLILYYLDDGSMDGTAKYNSYVDTKFRKMRQLNHCHLKCCLITSVPL